MTLKVEISELPRTPRTDALCRGLWDSIRTRTHTKPPTYRGGVFGVAGYEDITHSSFWYDMSHPAKSIGRRHVVELACRFLDCVEDDIVPVLRGWSQVYDKGEYIVPHSHDQIGYTDVAVCLNINGFGNLVLQDPQSGDIRKIETVPGRLIAFAGNVVHWSDPNELEEPRIVIATNVYLRSNPYAKGWEAKYQNIQ